MNKPAASDFDVQFREMLTRNYGQIDMSALQLYRSLAAAFHILSSQLEKNVSEYNLSPSKMRILFWLKMRYDEGTDGGGLLPSELSRFHGVTPNTMSSLLTSLRESGLIEQINHPNDRRKRVIKITQAGLELLHEAGPRYHDSMRQLFGELSEEERQILITLLQKVIVSAKSRMGCEHPSDPHPHRR